MNKAIALLTAFILATMVTQAQVLVQWTFPTGTDADSLADGGLPVNLDKAIHTDGGTSAIDFSKNGATTKSAQATGWDNGSMVKCWVISLNAQGYENLKLSSKMQSGGNNPGPRDFMVQVRIGTTGEWKDVPGSALIVANDWTTGVLDSLALPTECNNQPILTLRWIMTSNTNSQGEMVTASGINKIDDIYVTGKVMSTGINNRPAGTRFSMFPNPSFGELIVEASEPITSISIFSSMGRCMILESDMSVKKLSLDLGSFPRGTYFVKVRMSDGTEKSEKLVML